MSGITKEIIGDWRGQSVFIPTVKLEDVLAANDAPSFIDYLSLDVRGAEGTILFNFPFHRYRFGVISLNHDNAQWRNQLHTWLQANDYRFVEQNQWEDWFVHNSIFPERVPDSQPTLRVYPRLQQGLGNQLFAVAAALNYAKTHGGVLKWIESEATLDPSVNQHSGSYIGKLIHIPTVTYNGSVAVVNEPAHLEPVALPPPPKGCLNIVTNGYFQQITHVPDLTTVKEVIHWTSEDEAAIRIKYQDILTSDKATVSVHIRRGDYVKYFGNEVMRIIDYTERAIDYIKAKVSNPRFVFFSDDLEWTRQKYENEVGAVFIDRDLDHYELYVMSRCKHHIIANSSFSWWAAYLQENRDGITIAPYPWFADRPKAEMYLPDWIRLEGRKVYIPLLDLASCLITAVVIKDHNISDITLCINQAFFSPPYLTELVKVIFPHTTIQYINNSYTKPSHIEDKYPIVTYDLSGLFPEIPDSGTKYSLVITDTPTDLVADVVLTLDINGVEKLLGVIETIQRADKIIAIGRLSSWLAALFSKGTGLVNPNDPRDRIKMRGLSNAKPGLVVQ
jgi:hypothetical protein